MQRVNEGSRLRITATLLDPDDVPTTPTTLRYRLDCDTTGTVLIDWTDATAASTLEVVVAANSNRIINTRNLVERKVFTVEANGGTDDEFTDDVTYEVRNMTGVS